jgi:hypothetical protein
MTNAADEDVTARSQSARAEYSRSAPVQFFNNTCLFAIRGIALTVDSILGIFNKISPGAIESGSPVPYLGRPG